MPGPPVDRRLQLQIIFAFTFVFAVLLVVTRPDPTRGQIVFRSIMAAVGLIGFAMASRRPQ